MLETPPARGRRSGQKRENAVLSFLSDVIGILQRTSQLPSNAVGMRLASSRLDALSGPLPTVSAASVEVSDGDARPLVVL